LNGWFYQRSTLNRKVAYQKKEEKKLNGWFFFFDQKLNGCCIFYFGTRMAVVYIIKSKSQN
jgi:hypothetical protein